MVIMRGSLIQMLAGMIVFCIALNAMIIFGAVFLNNYAFLWALIIVNGISIPIIIILIRMLMKGQT